MKNLLLFIPITALLFSACEEVPPVIDFSVPVIPLKDSMYIATTVPSAQHKAVLIDDITGVRCNNCPDAAKKAMDILAQKSHDSVVVIALYANISSLSNFTTPFAGEKPLIYEGAKQIVESLGIPQGLPSGYVDRNRFAGKTERPIDRNEWINFVNERLKVKTPVNIALSRTINNRTLKVEINLAYNSAPVNANPHKYAIYILEDGIIGRQQNKTVEEPFELAVGNPLQGPYVAGKTFVKQFKYEVPAEFNLDNCHLVCAVMDGTTEEVINIREIDL
jgi:hypothetical protein